MYDKQPKRSPRQVVFLVILWLFSITAASIALLLPVLNSYRAPRLAVGQVSLQDYRAPRAVTYESEVLTQQAREMAAQNVGPIYTSPDTRAARRQLERLRASLAYISNVRTDSYATLSMKLEDLAALEDIQLPPETATQILALSDERWQLVQQETIAALERVMRDEIRPYGVSNAQARLPALVSLSLTEEQASLVAQLAGPFVVANSEYSDALTMEARQAASQAVAPVSRSFAQGETIASQGQVLDEAAVEALQKLGLTQPERKWQDFASAITLAGLLVTFFALFLRRKRSISSDMRSLTLIMILFLAYLFSARAMIPAHTIIPYAFPIAAFGLVIAGLFEIETALVLSLPLSTLAAYSLPNALELTFYYCISSLFGILTLGRARRLSAFFWAGAAVATSGVMVILIYRLPSASTDLVGLATLALASLFNGLACASVALLLQTLLAQFIGTTTSIQLIDLSRPDHPLLNILLREAPGTYQHSLQVSNLAEQAAERIGADTLLTRVGALYHDIGKTCNPFYFIENQPPGFQNPHDDLDPVESAQIIICHVTDGMELGRKYRLPRRILDFMCEHHGTSLARYQYVKAIQAAGGDESQVDANLFRYPGPRPQSRETAILMLADTCEARVRAERPSEEDEIRNIIKEAISMRLSSGQLDDTRLTFRDLNLISESFVATLRGIYHPRVIYPRLEPAAPELHQLPEPASTNLSNNP